MPRGYVTKWCWVFVVFAAVALPRFASAVLEFNVALVENNVDNGPEVTAFVEKVQALTDGEIQLTLFDPNTFIVDGQALAGDEIFEAVYRGQVDMGLIVSVLARVTQPDDTRVLPPFSRLYTSGSLFGLEFHEHVTWLLTQGGLALEEQLYNKALDAGKFGDPVNNGIVVLPLLGGPPEGAGMFRKPLELADFQTGPLTIRYLGNGARALRRAFPNLNVVVGIPGLAPYDAIIQGRLDAAEFSNPLSDLFSFFGVGNDAIDVPVSAIENPITHYYLGAWHQPFVIHELIVNKNRWNQLVSTGLSERFRSITREHLFISFANRFQKSSDALNIMHDQFGIQVMENFPTEILVQLKNAAVEVLNEDAATDGDFAEVLQSLRTFAATGRPYLNFGNIDRRDRFAD